MTGNWKPLQEELKIWQSEGLQLPFWWRDDDAIEPTSALDQLLQLSGSTGLPVHLAIIPAGATQHLADRLENAPQAVPIAHGYAHQNHAPASEKKCEFGKNRNEQSVREDIERGRSKLASVFGDNLMPMFVPPWNRFAAAHLPMLASAGYRAVSTFTPRNSTYAIAGVEQINTHLDPINWHGTRSCHAAEKLIAETVELLQKRRSGAQDNSEPLGYLTHHLVHDPAIWDFTKAFIETMLAGPVIQWTANSLKGPKT